MNYCGIDLHSNNGVVIVNDDGDRIRYRKRLPSELALITAALKRYRHEFAGIVVEST
jgi:transposase